MAHDFLSQLFEFANVLQGEKWQDQPIFTKYFKGEVFPKLALYSGHSSLAYLILKIFNLKMLEHSQPASALFLDFFVADGEDRVRLVYKQDSASEEKVLKLKQYRSDSMSLEQFKSAVGATLTEWRSWFAPQTFIEEWCLVPFDSQGVSYKGGKLWVESFFKHFNLPK